MRTPKRSAQTTRRSGVAPGASTNTGHDLAIATSSTRGSKAKRMTVVASSPTAAKHKKVEIHGKFTGNVKGFGFVTPQDGGADVFIPPHLTFGALHGDMVMCKIIHEEDLSQPLNPDKPSRTGAITDISNRAVMVGAFFIDGSTGFVRPVETKIPYVFEVLPKCITHHGLADGHRVLFSVKADIDHSRGKAMPCTVIDVIGHIHDPGVDVLCLVHQANVPYEFSDEVIIQANALPEVIAQQELIRRVDLRNILTFTIDGDDTKDIDDAISFEWDTNGNITLGVHIADVTHYVGENTPLDKSALERGTSIYLADRVIPMLPHRLSSGICSLLPNTDRLTLSCIMTINPQGEVTDYRITNSVINSKRRWTYNEVQEILDTNGIESATCEWPQAAAEATIRSSKASPSWPNIFHCMNNLRATLRQNRESKGALDFNLPEVKIRVNEQGHPISIDRSVRTDATAIIEEFMILCNETIAAHFLEIDDGGFPFVYRTHEPPTADKLTRLSNFTAGLGYKAPKSVKKPISLQRLLSKTAKTPAAGAIATAVLHSLPQARYTTHTATHYGLASDAYCHFTSPIRRYADLQIHRIIKTWLAQKAISHFESILPTVCAQCSSTERVAESLEREVQQLKKVQFMAPEEGKTFDATVSGVTSWGVYAMLDNTVEGLIPFENLRRHGFTFNKENSSYTSAAKKTNFAPLKKKRHKLKDTKKIAPQEAKTLRHGTPITVRLISANEDERKIIFYLEECR